MKNYQPVSQTSFRNFSESNHHIPSVQRYNTNAPFYNPQDKFLSPLAPSLQSQYNYYPSSPKSLYKVSSNSNLSQYHSPIQPHQPPCQCGMAVEATKLRIENSELKQQIQKLRQYSSSSSPSIPIKDDGFRAKFEIYQQYLSNSETNNDTLRKQNAELRKQSELVESYKRRIQLLQEQKRLMEQNLRQQMEENIRIQQQHQNDFYNSPAGVYVEELQKNNKYLMQENKRLSGIITQRIKNTFV